MNEDNSKRILTIPNIISLLRILLVIPICLFLWHDNLTLVAILINVEILQMIFTPLTVIVIILSSFSYSKVFFEKI